MRRVLLTVVPVVLVAFAGGAAIAGIPGEVPDDVQSVQIRPPATTTPPAPIDESNATPTSAGTPPAAAATSTTPASSTTSASSSTSSTTTTPLGGAASPTTTSTSSPETAVSLPEGEQQVVVANGARRPGAATEVAERLRSAGYETVVAADAIEALEQTVIYYATGQDAEARAVAAALGLAESVVKARPQGALTIGEEPGTVWVMLGSDLG